MDAATSTAGPGPVSLAGEPFRLPATPVASARVVVARLVRALRPYTLRAGGPLTRADLAGLAFEALQRHAPRDTANPIRPLALLVLHTRVYTSRPAPGRTVDAFLGRVLPDEPVARMEAVAEGLVTWQTFRDAALERHRAAGLSFRLRKADLDGLESAEAELLGAELVEDRERFARSREFHVASAMHWILASATGFSGPYLASRFSGSVREALDRKPTFAELLDVANAMRADDLEEGDAPAPPLFLGRDGREHLDVKRVTRVARRVLCPRESRVWVAGPDGERVRRRVRRESTSFDPSRHPVPTAADTAFEVAEAAEGSYLLERVRAAAVLERAACREGSAPQWILGRVAEGGSLPKAAEVAAACGCTASSARKHLERVTERLRRRFDVA